MSDLYRPFSLAIADLTAREIGERAKVTSRTAENWKQGLNGPSWRHIVTMLADPVMRPLVLQAADAAADQLTGRAQREVARLGT